MMPIARNTAEVSLGNNRVTAGSAPGRLIDDHAGCTRTRREDGRESKMGYASDLV